MVAVDVVRAAALSLPATSERTAPRTGHPQFMTSDVCFAELALDDTPSLKTWRDGSWVTVSLAETSDVEAEAMVLAAWRQRAKKWAVATLDYAIGRSDLSNVFAELRTWPDLTERGEGDFKAFGRAFLHFHHSETSRHADVKEGLGWGEPIPFPLGRPSSDLAATFFVEVRRRLEITRHAVAAAKATKRRPKAATK
jgi:hypothetical protein